MRYLIAPTLIQQPYARRWQGILSGVLLVIVLAGCQSSPSIDSTAIMGPGDIRRDSQQARTLQLLYRQHQDWAGTPYRIGGQSRDGIDCSAFVQITLRETLGIDLPRTTSEQVQAGRPISRNELQPGDLVFFRDGRHVGIYLEDNRFLHASTRRGVMISRLDNSYWSRHYWRALSVR